MKYWVYHEGEVPGAYEPHELAGLPGFTAASLVCPSDAASGDRRWQRAGHYPDIVEALRLHDLQPPPLAPASAAAYADPSAAAGPDDILNATSHRIFLHVTELMKELENRREEQALSQSLQRTLVELKGELHSARERIRFLDDRVSTIPATEERERRAIEEAERLRADIRAQEEKLRERDLRLSQLEQRLQEAALALDNALRGQTDAVREQKRLAQTVEDLNRQLALKESSLAKSIGMIRRLESELGHLLPGLSAAQASAKPAGSAPPPAPQAAPQTEPVPVSAGAAAAVKPQPVTPAPQAAPPVELRPGEGAPNLLSLDEPPPPPQTPSAPAHVPPPWQTALSEMASFIKRKLPGGGPEEKG